MWRCSSHRGVGHDPASPSHDRGHADPQSGTPNTQRVYVEQVARFARHFGKSPELLGPAEIRSMCRSTWPRTSALAASSIIVAVAALRFLYTVTLKRPWIVEDDIPAGRQARKLPVVLSPEEVAAFLNAVTTRSIG